MLHDVPDELGGGFFNRFRYCLHDFPYYLGQRFPNFRLSHADRFWQSCFYIAAAHHRLPVFFGCRIGAAHGNFYRLGSLLTDKYGIFQPNKRNNRLIHFIARDADAAVYDNPA